MAVDSALKRFSFINFMQPATAVLNPPEAGDMDLQGERQMLMMLYGGFGEVPSSESAAGQWAGSTRRRQRICRTGGR